MIEILISWLLQCILIPDVEEFGLCLDQVVLEYNLSVDGLQETSEEKLGFNP